MLSVLTPLSKVHRVSRKIDTPNFVAVPGIWAEMDTAGALDNVTTASLPEMAKLVIGNASANKYESHDVEVGRIATLESIGARVQVDTEGYVVTDVVVGSPLAVSATDGAEGKLRLAVATETQVAVAEEVDTTNSLLTYSLVSPTVLVTET